MELISGLMTFTSRLTGQFGNRSGFTNADVLPRSAVFRDILSAEGVVAGTDHDAYPIDATSRSLLFFPNIATRPLPCIAPTDADIDAMHGALKLCDFFDCPLLQQ